MLHDMVKMELIRLFTSICSFTHNCKQERLREMKMDVPTMPLAKTDATPAPAMATARPRVRWE